jgi:hypothetical protein
LTVSFFCFVSSANDVFVNSLLATVAGLVREDVIHDSH